MNAEPSFDSLFSVGGFETPGPGWDHPHAPPAPHAPLAPHAPAPSGNGTFKKNRIYYKIVEGKAR